MQALNGNLLEFGDFQLDTGKKILRREGEIVALPLKAVELLSALAENPGEVVAKADLMEKVWADAFVEDSVLTQNIYLLRKTLGKNDLIKNVPRRGYIFNADVKTIYENGLTHPIETNGAETVIERHLFEKISLEEIEGDAETRRQGDAEKERNLLSFIPASPRFRVSALIVAVAVLLGLTVSAYFYFREDSRQTVGSVPPVKYKTVSAPSVVKTLAVLPLRSANEKLAAEFSNNLSIRLGSQNKFTVKPYELVKEYLQTDADLKTDFVLDGGVEAKTGLYSANVRLLDVKTGAEIFGQKFEFDNQIQLEDAVANRVGKEIFERLTDAEREAVSRRLPSNFSAYINFLKGFRLWRNRQDGSKYFEKAIELDQSFARAYVGLASQKMFQGVKDSPAAKETDELLRKAFELDDNSADAYAAQGFIRIFHHRDWAGAEKSLKNAIALDANNVNAHHWLAVFYSIHRRLDEAKAEMQTALELDPTNPTLLADLGQIHYFAGETDSAIKYCEKAIFFDPHHIFANEYLSKIKNPQQINDIEQALQELSRFANENHFTLPYINVDPVYDSLRGEPGFQEILQKMNLTP